MMTRENTLLKEVFKRPLNTCAGLRRAAPYCIYLPPVTHLYGLSSSQGNALGCLASPVGPNFHRGVYPSGSMSLMLER